MFGPRPHFVHKNGEVYTTALPEEFFHYNDPLKINIVERLERKLFGLYYVRTKDFIRWSDAKPASLRFI